MNTWKLLEASLYRDLTGQIYTDEGKALDVLFGTEIHTLDSELNDKIIRLEDSMVVFQEELKSSRKEIDNELDEVRKDIRDLEYSYYDIYNKHEVSQTIVIKTYYNLKSKT